MNKMDQVAKKEADAEERAALKFAAFK